MNFKDIFAQWEALHPLGASDGARLKSGGAHAKKTPQNRAGASDVSAAAENSHAALESWLCEHGVIDKDALYAEQKKHENLRDDKKVHLAPADEVIDLHGLSRDEAWRRLDAFVTACAARGCAKLLIIHGKGNHSGKEPVLADLVRSFIEYDSRLGKSGHPGIRDGGSGATWVLIKQNVRSV